VIDSKELLLDPARGVAVEEDMMKGDNDDETAVYVWPQTGQKGSISIVEGLSVSKVSIKLTLS
jgi:hypothetical protein